MSDTELAERKDEDTNPYGMGRIFLQSIQTLILKANYCTSLGDFGGWRINLDCISRKCASQFTGEEQKQVTTITNDLELISFKHTVSLNKDSRKVSGQTSKRTIVLGRLHAGMLAKYEIFILKILHRIGWLVPAEKKKQRAS